VEDEEKVERVTGRNAKVTSEKSKLRKLAVNSVVISLALPSMLIVFTSLVSQPTIATGWGPRVLVSLDNLNNTDLSFEQATATDIFGNVYVVWSDLSQLDGSGPDMDIFLRKWNASTQIWGKRILITDDNLNNTFASVSADVAVDSSGNTHVAWRQNGNLDGIGSDPDVFWKMWDSKAQVWTTRYPITNESDIPYGGHGPKLAADHLGNVHLAWERVGIEYAMWNGTTGVWEQRAIVSDNQTNSRLHDIAVDPSGNVHVAFGDNTGRFEFDIYYRYLNTSTGIWGPIILVNDDDLKNDTGSNFWGISSDVFGNVHLVWDEYGDQGPIQHGGDHDIFYRKWSVATGSFEPRVLVSNDPANTGPSQFSGICSDPLGNLHVVWQDRSDVDGAGDVNRDIFYKSWDISTGTWQDTISLTNDLQDMYGTGRPDISCDDLGNVVVSWSDGSTLLGSGGDGDVFIRRFTGISTVIPFIALKAEVADIDDVLLEWTVPVSLDVEHYLIYRSPDQREFDFSSPVHNTSNDSSPLRTNWTDIDAASPTASREYYYIVRAVTKDGTMSITSNTAGKWTKNFSSGVDSFSLPLEPFVSHNISWLAVEIPNTTYIRWMDSSGHWIIHHDGMAEGTNDVKVEMGRGYEIHLTSDTIYTFCGYPASMIRFSEGLRDPTDFRKSLTAQEVGADVVLTWDLLNGATGYMIYKSNRRNGLHDFSLQPIGNVPSTLNTWTDLGVLATEGEYYYMVIPLDSQGRLGSSTYSVGVFTVEYESGSDTFALPLEFVDAHSLDQYCDEIPDTVGMAYLTMGSWKFHAKEMPEGVYDIEVLQGDGYQISIDGSSMKFTFIGY
jgi:hypothetical protein